MKLQFWFEFASTYSYPAAMRIEKLCAGKKIQVEWKPFLLGPIFQKQGWKDSPFNLFPEKGKYMWRDLERLCVKYDLDFRKPSEFPRNGLLAARVACVGMGQNWLPSFVRKIYEANFAKDENIASPEVLEKILKSLNQNPSEILGKASSTENKDKLRLQTEEAQQHGIFGAPSFRIEGELFWGNDRLEEALVWPFQKSF